jgi:hypothetical protein
LCGLGLLGLVSVWEQATGLHDFRKEPEHGRIGTENGANQQEAQ